MKKELKIVFINDINFQVFDSYFFENLFKQICDIQKSQKDKNEILACARLNTSKPNIGNAPK